MPEAKSTVVPLGNAVPANARKAQMVEHFARKLDSLLAAGATELSAVYVLYGYTDENMSNTACWDVADNTQVPVRILLNDASALIQDEAAAMRGLACTPSHAPQGA